MFAAPIVFDDVSTQERYEPFRAKCSLYGIYALNRAVRVMSPELLTMSDCCSVSRNLRFM